MTINFTRTLRALGLAALMAGGIVAVPVAAEAAPAKRVVYRNGQWYTIGGQKLKYKNGAWFTPSGSRRWDLDKDGIPNRRDRDRDGDGVRNKKDNHPNNAKRGTKDRDGDGIRNSRDRDRDGDGVRNKKDDRPNNRNRR